MYGSVFLAIIFGWVFFFLKKTTLMLTDLVIGLYKHADPR